MYQWDEERLGATAIPGDGRKGRTLCGPIGRVVGLFTLALALHGMLARTSYTASLLAAQTMLLPVTNKELKSCLSRNCNATLTALGTHWFDTRNAQLLKCLTHSGNATAAAKCWDQAVGDTKYIDAVRSCAEQNLCVASVSSPTPAYTPISSLPPIEGSPAAGGPGFDWSHFAGNWQHFVPAQGAAPGAAQQGQAVPGTLAYVADPVAPPKSNSEFVACIRSKCSNQCNKLGSSWSNPVNTELAACLTNSEGGLAAAVTCFPPVNPDFLDLFHDSTALRYCALCSSCIAGDRGAVACSKGGSGVHEKP